MQLDPNLKNWLDEKLEERLNPADFFNKSTANEDIVNISNLIALFTEPQILTQYTSKVHDEIYEDVIQAELILHLLTEEFKHMLKILNIPLDLRIKAVDSTYQLFSKWYMQLGQDLDKDWNQSCHMFWDVVCFSYHNKENEKTDEQKAINDAIFKVLCQILRLPNKQIQISALHGLNHLKDERAKLVIDNFIRLTKDKELTKWAKYYKTFKGM